MKNYSIYLMWSDEDGGYVVTVPELRNLAAFGESADEALGEALTAIEGYLETYAAEGIPIPEPRKSVAFSGQVRVRLGRSLHRDLALAAQREGVSLNSLIVSLLSHNYALHKAAEIQRTAYGTASASVVARWVTESDNKVFENQAEQLRALLQPQDMTQSFEPPVATLSSRRVSQ